MNKYGELVGQEAIRFRRLLPGPIDRVWSYLTESDKRATWLASGETELREGGCVELIFRNASLSKFPDEPPPEKYKDMPDCVSFVGEVTSCEPPTLLIHTWVDGDETTEVRYELEERGDDVLLTLTHTRLATRDTLLSVSGGWHTHLDILAEVMTGQEPQPFWKRHSALEAEYERRISYF